MRPSHRLMPLTRRGEQQHELRLRPVGPHLLRGARRRSLRDRGVAGAAGDGQRVGSLLDWLAGGARDTGRDEPAPAAAGLHAGMRLSAQRFLDVECCCVLSLRPQFAACASSVSDPVPSAALHLALASSVPYRVCVQVGSACSAVLCLAFPFAPSAAAAALCMAALKLALCYSGAGFSSNYYEIGGQQTALISGVGPSPAPHAKHLDTTRPNSRDFSSSLGLPLATLIVCGCG